MKFAYKDLPLDQVHGCETTAVSTSNQQRELLRRETKITCVFLQGKPQPEVHELRGLYSQKII